MIEERRRHPRIDAKGTVVVGALGFRHHARLVNVSGGGLFALTSVTAPERWLSRVVDTELRLDAASAEWLVGAARVVRVRSDAIALAFETAPPRLGAVLDELTGAWHVRQRMLAVVLIDTDSARRSTIASGFRMVGCSVVEAASPLEAIVRLGESSFEPDVIAIADTAGTAADDLRAFVRHNHPSAKLIVIDELLGLPTGVDLLGRVRALLSRALAT
jgi:CheY-like chemotaxis protein